MQGRTAFISGGTSGINLGIARSFVRQGASVLVFGRDQAKAARAAEDLRREPGSGGAVMDGAADVRDPEAIRALFARASTELGQPDIVIAGAAGNFMAPASSLSANGFKAVVDIDLLGTFNVFRAGYDIARKPGAAFIAITAPQGAHPLSMQAHVCAAKAGVNMLVRCLALEWGSEGVRVIGIAPGPILGTEGVNRMAPTDAEKHLWAQKTPLKRFGTVGDIATAASFLCSVEASYVTGTILDCDGGMQLGDATAL